MTVPQSNEIAPLSATEAAAQHDAGDAAAQRAGLPLDGEAAPAPTGIRGLIVRFEHIIRELLKFGAVGGVSFAVDLTIYNLLLNGGMETILAASISMVIAATVAFIGNRFWTWRDRERTGLRREYTLYFIFNLIGLLIALAVLGASHYGLGAIWPWFESQLADNLAKSGLGTALGTLFRFWSYRAIVFKVAPENPVNEADNVK